MFHLFHRGPRRGLANTSKLPALHRPVQEPISTAESPPWPPDDPPELAAWDDITVEEAGRTMPQVRFARKVVGLRQQTALSAMRADPPRLALADLAARIRSRKR